MQQKLRVGVIGAGSWTRICHIPALQADHRAEVTALCGRRLAQAREQATEFGIPKVFTDYHELIESGLVDAVTISTPNVHHYEIAMAATHARKHVFCEKPLAMNETQSSEMLRAATKLGVVSQVAFTFRHLYSAQLAREWVTSGRLGTILRVTGFAEGSSGLLPNRTYNWRDSTELAGTGMLGDMGSHLVDLARFTTGLEFSCVAGRLRTLPRIETTPALTVTSDDDAEFLAQLGDIDGYFRSSRIVRGGRRSYLEICGTNGALRVNYSRGNIDEVLCSEAQSGEYRTLPLPDGAKAEHNHALFKMMSAFITECIGQPRPYAAATFYDGHKTQSVLDAVARSSAAQSVWEQVRA